MSKRVRELLQIKINITTGGSAPPRPRVPYGSSNTETRQELHGRRWSDGRKGALECFRAGALPVLWAPEPEHAPHGASGAPEKIPPLTARMSGAVVDLVCSDQLSRGLRAWQARLRHPAGRLLGDCDLLRSTSQLLVSYAQGEGYGRCAGAVVLGYTAGAHRSIWRSNVRLRRNTGGPIGVSKATGRVRACAMRTRVPARGKQKFHVSCTHRVVLFWRKWFIRE